MVNSKGNTIANQFIINDGYKAYFQSYDSLIVCIESTSDEDGELIDIITLDRDTWDYSQTTSKYRNQFLGETKAQTQAKINSGEYQLTDLNGG